MPTRKELTLLHLQRRLDAISDVTPDHVRLAQASTDYKARQRAVEASEAEREKHKFEIDALKTAIAFVEQHATDDVEVKRTV